MNNSDHVVLIGKAINTVGQKRKVVLTMKKTIAILLTVMLMVSLSTTAFAATIESGTGSSSTDVKAKYNASTPADVYSVDITWGAMEFNYNAAGQKWDTESHKYVADDQAPAAWEVNNSSNTITLENNSSKAVAATLAFTADSSYSGISGEFTYNSQKLTTALTLEKPAENTDAKSYVVSFMPSGALASTHSSSDYAKIGSITVTLG